MRVFLRFAVARQAARAARYAFCCALWMALTGCSTQFGAVGRSIQQLTQRGSNADGLIVPEGHYFLRVTTGGHTAILGLERVEPHPQGRILVWTSEIGEVLRIQEGRLIGAVGLRTEWRSVAQPAMPDWPEIAAMQKPFQWIRTRDVMPGYRFGTRDELSVRPIPPPEKTQLRVIDPQTLTWFEERFERAPASGDPALASARYAVRMQDEAVLYGEQCLAPDLCITWQRWTSELQQANRQKMTQPLIR